MKEKIKNFIEKINRNKWTWLVFYIIDFIFFILVQLYFIQICFIAGKEPVFFKSKMHTIVAIIICLNLYMIMQCFIITQAQKDLKMYFKRKEQQNDHINNN